VTILLREKEVVIFTLSGEAKNKKLNGIYMEEGKLRTGLAKGRSYFNFDTRGKGRHQGAGEKCCPVPSSVDTELQKPFIAFIRIGNLPSEERYQGGRMWDLKAF